MNENFFTNNTIEDIYDEMRQVYLNDKRPWIIGYSGGKDSTVVVQLAFQMLMDLPKEQQHKPIYIVSSDTLIENPLILEYLQKNIDLINKSAKNLELPIEAHLVAPEPNNTFWTNIIGRGYPTPKSIQYRWCTEKLKIRPSNKFILEQLKSREVVILLGVRKAESFARKRRIENRQIDGYLLTPHATLRNKNNIAYVYNPIVDLTTDDVWDILKSTYPGGNEDAITPWGSNNMELAVLYAKGSTQSNDNDSEDTECPFTTSAENTNSCGNSRFGCWICTVVKEDKSLNGFIHHEQWLAPLRDFRTWLIDIRGKEEYRKKHRRNGSVHKTKDGRIAFGPFNFEGRKLILTELLKLQLKIQQEIQNHNTSFANENLELITLEELKAIDEIWDAEEDLNRNTLVDIYYEVTGRKLPWHEYKKPMFDETALITIDSKCEKHDVDPELFNRLLIETDKYKHFSNPKKLKDSITKILNQQWIHSDIMKKIEQDSQSIKEITNENKQA